MNRIVSTMVVVWAALALACGGSDAGSAADAEGSSGGETETGAAPAPATFAEQVTLGQTLYAEKCASCHGAAGEGSDKAPAVVGLDRGALPLDPPAGARYRTTQFRTVADIATFVVANMPPQEGGSLSEEQYWSILAFDLHANGIDLDQKLDGAKAATLTLPGR